MQLLHGRDWCDSTGGNFSVVVHRQPLRLLMAPSGVDKGSVMAAELIEVNQNGLVVDGEGRASAETLMHLRIIDACAAGAVLHTHSLAGTLLSRVQSDRGGVHLEGWEMLKGIKGISTHQSEITIPIIANNQDLKILSESAAPHFSRAPLHCWSPAMGSTPGEMICRKRAGILRSSSSFSNSAGEKHS